ncbi:response regulator transcription factor [Ktedonosporobacter rubrisoli]|uniref:Response regulator transcription factor n=1 Tax=Ktedonosporobacter rubrisoli TaxID=2509675 RepID=A0A4P6K6B3_KTERU|nr:response regulator transcription factor [Ktedonosporobacter rubrisoli]QBD83126.1 response regulator transcription factor [Ktedonosporobacter rubrisoli]
MKLLIVDSDRHMVEMLAAWLRTQGHDVSRAYTGMRAKIEWEEKRPDMVIIDTALKDVDTLEMCREMQRKHDALVLALTDDHDVQNEVRFLEAVADDYLHKPFFPAQLTARLRAMSRRVRSSLKQRAPSRVTVGSLSIDTLNHEVRILDKNIRLTPTESKLLHLLASNANTVCTANQIVTYVWGFGDTGDSSLIKAHIRHLRQKIEADPANPRYLLTVPGVGYTLVHPSTHEKGKLAFSSVLQAVSM